MVGELFRVIGRNPEDSFGCCFLLVSVDPNAAIAGVELAGGDTVVFIIRVVFKIAVFIDFSDCPVGGGVASGTGVLDTMLNFAVFSLRFFRSFGRSVGDRRGDHSGSGVRPTRFRDALFKRLLGSGNALVQSLWPCGIGVDTMEEWGLVYGGRGRPTGVVAGGGGECPGIEVGHFKGDRDEGEEKGDIGGVVGSRLEVDCWFWSTDFWGFYVSFL